MKNLTKRAYSGIRQRHINEVVWNIYGYKFFQNEDCFRKLVSMAIEDLEGWNFDTIIPVKPRNSGSDIVVRLASKLADHFSCELYDCLSASNGRTLINDLLKDRNVLIIDDVYFTGRTADKANSVIKKLKPKALFFYALAKSTTK